MKFINELIIGLSSYIKAIYLIGKYQLHKYLGLLLLLLLFFLLPVLFFDGMVSIFLAFIPYSKSAAVGEIAVSFLSGFSGFILLLMLIPIFTLVSVEVTRRQEGKIYKFSMVQFSKDIIRGLRITLRNLLLEYLLIAILAITLFFLPKNSITYLVIKFLFIVITSYFYGFSMINYPLENYRYSYKESIHFMHSHIGAAMGIGIVYYLVISANNHVYVQQLFGRFTVYWSAFAESLIAFIGVVAASVAISKIISKQSIDT